MDDIVKAALKKWPNVPHCYGWLALDARGDWYMRDDRIQATGPFPLVKGSRITHDKLIGFIQRNYAQDAHGAWYFQNGPQRVYVELEAAPFVLGVQRRGDRFEVQTHTGQAADEVRSSWLDEQGRLFLDTSAGFGIVRSADMAVAAEAVERGLWQPQDIQWTDLPTRFGYQIAPTQATAPGS